MKPIGLKNKYGLIPIMRKRNTNTDSQLLDNPLKKYRIQINERKRKQLYTLEEIKKLVNKYKNSKLIITIYELPYLPLEQEQLFLFNSF